LVACPGRLVDLPVGEEKTTTVWVAPFRHELVGSANFSPLHPFVQLVDIGKHATRAVAEAIPDYGLVTCREQMLV
jgi:hypothetical protein